ncbi:MAG: putative 4-hydroxybenzoate polyprenyltransferase [Desulfobulbus sp.]|nr:putative 4-hydroxybenzoate polyprenyltransferase [Desulfobulbus sp.]
MWRKLTVLLEMIKFEHTVFAMPFALMGAFLAARGVPSLRVFLWVILAMVGARTCAMGFNRIVDRRFDAVNPRTAARALPAGQVTLLESWLMVIMAALLFFLACFMLNALALKMGPLVLGLTLFYSVTKRFTWLCHMVLGLALALSPMGGWVAVSASFQGYPWVLSLGVLLWVAGFDCIYACLDADFDREAGLFSMPAIFGRRNGFRIAVIFHALAYALFILTGLQTGLNYWYYCGIAVTGVALFYQHLIVTPKDLSRIKQSFFSMNGLISLTLFITTCIALATGA